MVEAMDKLTGCSSEYADLEIDTSVLVENVRPHVDQSLSWAWAETQRCAAKPEPEPVLPRQACQL